MPILPPVQASASEGNLSLNEEAVESLAGAFFVEAGCLDSNTLTAQQFKDALLSRKELLYSLSLGSVKLTEVSPKKGFWSCGKQVWLSLQRQKQAVLQMRAWKATKILELCAYSSNRQAAFKASSSLHFSILDTYPYDDHLAEIVFSLQRQAELMHRHNLLQICV